MFFYPKKHEYIVLVTLDMFFANSLKLDGAKISKFCRLIKDYRYLLYSRLTPGFYTFAVEIFENSVGKVEIVRNEQFLLFSLSVFYTFG